MRIACPRLSLICFSSTQQVSDTEQFYTCTNTWSAIHESQTQGCIKNGKDKPTETVKSIPLLSCNKECLMWAWTALLTGLLALGLLDHHSQWCWKLQSVVDSKQNYFSHLPSRAGLHIPVHCPIIWTPMEKEKRQNITSKALIFF